VAPEPGPVLSRAQREEVRAQGARAGAARAAGPLNAPAPARRDFANGFLFAEVLSRYYPVDVEMHSFENVASTELKRANWAVLERLFKVGLACDAAGRRGGAAPRRARGRGPRLQHRARFPPRAPRRRRRRRAPLCCASQRRGVPVDARQVEAVMAAEGDAAAELLQLLYGFINSDAFA
jgi:hypothetical protein